MYETCEAVRYQWLPIVEMESHSEVNFQISCAPSFCGELTILAVHGLVESLDDSKTRGLASVCIEISRISIFLPIFTQRCPNLTTNFDCWTPNLILNLSFRSTLILSLSASDRGLVLRARAGFLPERVHSSQLRAEADDWRRP